jgi:hypothetical protein
MAATPQIGRKLDHKRKERRLLSQAVQQIVRPPAPPAPLSLAEFEAELDALAEGSENRPAPSADSQKAELTPTLPS